MSTFNDIKKLREKRAGLVENAGKILTEARSNDRNLTDEEGQKFQGYHTEADGLKKQIDVLERQRQAENDLANLEPIEGAPQQHRGSQGPEYRARLLRSFILGDEDESQTLNEKEMRDAIGMGINFRTNKMRLNLNRKAPRTVRETRALGVGSATTGGNLVPDEMMRAIELALLEFGGMREVSTIIRTTTGGDLPIPTSDDTGNTGEILGESAAVNEQDVEFGQLVLQAFKYSSKMVKVSVELLQDSSVNLEQLLGTMLGERIGRIHNTHFTTGTGSGQPNGIITASTLGKTAALATAVTFLELLDLKHSVDPAYRKGGRASWMFNDNTLLALKKLVDGDNRPLFQAGFAVGEPDRIDGDPFVINQDVATIASAAKTILYGDLSKYWIRDVLEIIVLVLRERFADNHQVGFLAFNRSDGDLLDAGTNPVKFLQQAT